MIKVKGKMSAFIENNDNANDNLLLLFARGKVQLWSNVPQYSLSKRIIHVVVLVYSGNHQSRPKKVHLL